MVYNPATKGMHLIPDSRTLDDPADREASKAPQETHSASAAPPNLPPYFCFINGHNEPMASPYIHSNDENPAKNAKSINDLEDIELAESEDESESALESSNKQQRKKKRSSTAYRMFKDVAVALCIAFTMMGVILMIENRNAN
jgi:hypothetical protein